jgi:hypothetical protein
MVRQAVLPFKLKRTDEQTTARSGLTLYAGFLENREDPRQGDVRLTGFLFRI